MPTDDRPSPSPLAEALDRVGDRWSLLVIDALLLGPAGFNELQERLPGIAPNVLSQRLKHLERERIIVARPYSERPLRLAYALTATGADLAGVLRMLSSWGAAVAGGAEVPRHDVCGTALEARWYCPTCPAVVEEPGGPGEIDGAIRA